MARMSKTAGHVKLADGDTIRVMGVPAKVESITILPAFAGHKAGVLVVARIGHAETTNVFDFSDVEAVRMGKDWVNMQGEAVS